ncbi:MAG: hypothetical protein Fur0015_10970 [Ignavibacteriales bacterium]
MRIKTSLSNGFFTTLSLVRLVLVIYVITFVFGLFLGVAFNLSMSSFKFTPMLSGLFSDFDFTIFSEFMNANGKSVTPFINSMIVFSFFYLLLEILFAGGLIGKLFSPGKKIKMAKFFASGVRYFWRFTKLFFYKILSLLIIFAVVITVASAISGSSAGNAVETDYVKVAVIATILFLVFFIIISAISDYAKIFIVGENIKSVWTSIKSAFRFIIRNFITGVGLYKVGLFIFIILTIFYLLLSDIIPVANMFSLFVLFIIQQLFIFLRIFTKIYTLAAEFDFYASVKISESKKKDKIQNKKNTESGN